MRQVKRNIWISETSVERTHDKIHTGFPTKIKDYYERRDFRQEGICCHGNHSAIVNKRDCFPGSLKGLQIPFRGVTQFIG